MAPEERTPREQTGPRRSALLQKRSRETRRNLVRAAMTLWTARGFERGVEETTVEEIAREAGVTKGTFYFHFAHKEEILLEMGWGTADSVGRRSEADRSAGLPAEQVLHHLLDVIAGQIGRAPRAAVARSMFEFHRVRRPARPPEDAERDDRAEPLSPGDRPVRQAFRRIFADVVAYGQERGEFTGDVVPGEIGALLEAVTMEALMRWANGDEEPLADALHRYAEIVVVGSRARTEPARA